MDGWGVGEAGRHVQRQPQVSAVAGKDQPNFKFHLLLPRLITQQQRFTSQFENSTFVYHPQFAYKFCIAYFV